MSKKQEYVCSHCDYSTFKNSEYQKHIKTKKHLRKKGLLIESDNIHVCECGNSYKTRSGFYKHTQTCYSKKADNKAKEPTSAENQLKAIENSNMSIDQYLKMRELELREKELQIQSDIEKEKMRLQEEHNKCQLELEEQRMNREEKRENLMINAMEKVGSAVTNNTVNNTVNNNNNFNLQLYLNDTCKDAMNIMDFVKSLKCSAEDIERVGRIGYAEAISMLMIEGLKDMDESKRPIHCTDVKREKMYIKDEDEWTKDESNNKLKRAINAIGRNNLEAIQEWKDKHPEHNNPQLNSHKKYLEICTKTMDGLMDEDNREYKKIVKRIAPETTINKDEVASVKKDVPNE
tara:strand:- start:701 stop:1741 length:1041 start_codon:yes stop_codon:yes gene_type:complete